MLIIKQSDLIGSRAVSGQVTPNPPALADLPPQPLTPVSIVGIEAVIELINANE